DAIAFGCPAMGDEVLEETVFQPMWDDVKGSLAGKKVALFGSYGWGDGQWMRDWEADASAAGVALATGSVICNDAPDDEATAALEALARAIG
ncbi:MAG: flavodoxin, partial [Clostridia bacterium]|nr:flavodoxin [Clostridia bacterium]